MGLLGVKLNLEMTTSFITFADTTFSRPETPFVEGDKIHVAFRSDGTAKLRALPAETRELRSEKIPSLLVGLSPPPASAHLVFESDGIWVYETYWSLASRTKRLIRQWEPKVVERKNAIGPMLTVVADTMRLLFLRALKHDITDFEREKYSELSGKFDEIVLGKSGVGVALNESFWLCKKIIAVIHEAEMNGWRQSGGGEA